MKKWILTICALVLMGVAQPALAGEFLKARQDGIPNRYLVVLDPAASELTEEGPGSAHGAAKTQRLADAIAAQVRIRPAAVYDRVGQFLIVAPERVARRLAEDPRVLFVEQDAKIQFSVIPSCYDYTPNWPLANSYDPVSPQTITCWDPQLSCSDNWGLDRIDQRTGSQSAHTLDGKYYFGANGAGAHIYILDTGIAGTHTEFALPGGGTRIGNGISVVPGGSSSDTWDYVGHGTHVAAIAAGRRFGVAKGATLHPVRIADGQGNGTLSYAVDGINWIAANAQRPAVVNMSFNFYKGYYETSSLDAATSSLILTYGITVANSAGNWNKDASAFSPTAVPQVIVAAGLDWFNNQRWGADPNQNCHTVGCGSNWGSSVDLYAPATDVLSALGSGEANRACNLTGTSMAAPHVAGVAAQYLQTHPNALPAEVESVIVSMATTGVVTGNLGGSPNRLLYTNF